MRHSASSKLRPVLIAVSIIIVIAVIAIGLIIRQAQARYQSTVYTGNSSAKIDTTKPPVSYTHLTLPTTERV